MSARALALSLAMLLPLFAPLTASLPSSGSFSHSTSSYSATFEWGGALASSETLRGTLTASGRSAAFTQTLALADVFGFAEVEPFSMQVLEAVVEGTPEAPILRLEMGSPVRELSGEVTLTFLDERIVHRYEFHVPDAAVFAPTVRSVTRLGWSAAFPERGTAVAGGAVGAGDGSALDAFGAWEDTHRYGIFLRDGATGLVGHARYDQGGLANYLSDGSMRSTPTSTTVTAFFTGFLDAPSAGLDQGLWVRDELVFLEAGATGADLRSDLDSFRLITGERLFFDPALVDVPPPTGPIPHVIVGVPDSGINPYHEAFRRPNLTAHPCTYIPEFPCSVPALALTLNAVSYDAALAADAAKWAALQPGVAYWIPGTAFVAAMCEDEPPAGERCILDEDGHGTGTTSSIATENPNALLAFKEGSSRIQPLLDAGIPIDIFSESWGNIAPIPGHPAIECVNFQTSPIFVTAAGNDPRSTLIDCRKGEPGLITVGGAYAADETEEALATKQPEVVSYYCRPTAVPGSLTATRPSFCGTSFATPTVAGALSKVVLGLRRSSGYTGSIAGDAVDPLLGISANDLRDALNRTASYHPTPQYANTDATGLPLVPGRPWLQWGWGFYDGTVANATLAHLLGTTTAPEKPEGAKEHMARMHAAKTALYGPLP